MNAKAVKLSAELVSEAETYGDISSRSVPKQIEHWVKIGKIAEANPDMSYEMIKNILISQKELGAGKVNGYKFG